MLYSELQEDFYETYCQTSGRCRWDPRPGWSLHPDEPPWHESLYLHRGHKAHLSTSRSLKDSFFSSQNNSESLCTQCLWSGSCETWSHQSGSPSLEWWTQLGSSCRLTWLVIKEFDVSIFMSSDGYWKRGMTHHLIYMIWPRQSWGRRERDNTIYCPQKPITHLISVHGCLCSYCHLPVLWAKVLAGKFPGHTQPRLRY